MPAGRTARGRTRANGGVSTTAPPSPSANAEPEVAAFVTAIDPLVKRPGPLAVPVVYSCHRRPPRKGDLHADPTFLGSLGDLRRTGCSDGGTGAAPAGRGR